jgi:hypothetical protein
MTTTIYKPPTQQATSDTVHAAFTEAPTHLVAFGENVTLGNPDVQVYSILAHNARFIVLSDETAPATHRLVWEPAGEGLKPMIHALDSSATSFEPGTLLVTSNPENYNQLSALMSEIHASLAVQPIDIGFLNTALSTPIHETSVEGIIDSLASIVDGFWKTTERTLSKGHAAAHDAYQRILKARINKTLNLNGITVPDEEYSAATIGNIHMVCGDTLHLTGLGMPSDDLYMVCKFQEDPHTGAVSALVFKGTPNNTIVGTVTYLEQAEAYVYRDKLSGNVNLLYSVKVIPTATNENALHLLNNAYNFYKGARELTNKLLESYSSDQNIPAEAKAPLSKLIRHPLDEYVYPYECDDYVGYMIDQHYTPSSTFYGYSTYTLNKHKVTTLLATAHKLANL